MKAALEAPIVTKEKKIIIEPIKPIDPSIREREIIQEAIAEMLEGKSFLDESAAAKQVESEDIDYEGFMNRVRQPKNVETRHLFVSQLEIPNATSNSVSLQRKHVESQNMGDIAALNQITLPDNIQDPLQNRDMEFIGEFGEATKEDAARMGFFEGKEGRKIFDIITDKEDRNELRRTDEENLLTNQQQQMRMTSFNNELTPLVPIEVQEDLLPQIEDQQEHPQIPIEDQQEHPQIPIENQSEHPQIPIEGQEDHLPIEDQQIHPQISIENQRQSGSSLVSLERDSMRESLYNQRMEMIVNASINENPENVELQPKPKRKARVPRKRGLIAVGSTTKLSKPIPKKINKLAVRRETPNIVDYEMNFHNMDYFKEVDFEFELPDYEIEMQPEANEIELEMEQIAQENALVNEATTTNKRRIESPTPAENASKKKKNFAEVSSSALEPQFPDLSSIPIIEMSTPIAVPQAPLVDNLSTATVADIVAPQMPQFDNSNVAPITDLLTTQPQILDSSPLIMPPINLTATNQEILGIPQSNEQTIVEHNISPPEVDIIRDSTPIARLSHNEPPLFKTPSLMSSAFSSAFSSLRKKRQQNDSNLVTRKDYEYARLNQLSKQQASLVEPIQNPVIPAEEPLSNMPKLYKEARKDGIDYIQFETKDKKKVMYEEFNIENMMLYMQIRKYMKAKSTWKMLVSEIIDKAKLRLFECDDKIVITHRLWLLCDHNFLNGTWAEDDPTKLLEIEIPVRQKTQVEQDEDKENLP